VVLGVVGIAAVAAAVVGEVEDTWVVVVAEDSPVAAAAVENLVEEEAFLAFPSLVCFHHPHLVLWVSYQIRGLKKKPFWV